MTKQSRPSLAPTANPTENTRTIPRYHVILLDDNDHSFNYVIRMTIELFGFDAAKACSAAEEVHSTGRTILATLPLEHAEVKQQQVHAYGPDPYIANCSGSMTCILEPAE